MLHRLRSRARAAAYGALTSKTGDRLLPVRLAKKALLYANGVAGRPIHEPVATTTGTSHKPAPPQAAPVVLFHDGRTGDVPALRKVLKANDVPHQVRNLEGDEPSLKAIKREANGYNLPVVFVAGSAIGGLRALVQLAERDELRPLVFGNLGED